jgi:hypothetical protein
MTAENRKAPCRYYIDSETDNVIARVVGHADVVYTTLQRLDATVLGRLALEGFIALVSRPDADSAKILAGKAFPDRSLPVAGKKEPTAWIKAMAQVRADDRIKSKRSAGEKVLPMEQDIIRGEALVWAAGLTPEQHAKLKESIAVRAAHAKLTGKPQSIDDLLAEVAAPTAEPDAEPAPQAEAAE